MATFFTHIALAITVGNIVTQKKQSLRFWGLSLLCTVLPDFDVIGFSFGIHYQDFWGHRGFTHSLLFAFLVGLLVVIIAFRNIPRLTKQWWGFVLYFFIITASHGVLDAFTDGGLGIAFFSPFDQSRYFFPWRPLHVSPIGSHFFTKYGWEVLKTEMLWIWLPLISISLVLFFIRSKKKS